MKIERVYFGSQFKGGRELLAVRHEVTDLLAASLRKQRDLNAGAQPAFSHTVKIPGYGIVLPTLKMACPPQGP